MLSNRHTGTDPAPRLVAQNLCVREGSQPSLLFTPLLQTQEDAAAGKFSLCLACLWGPDQNKASVYVPCLSPSNPPQAVAPAGPLGALHGMGVDSEGFQLAHAGRGGLPRPRPPAGLPPVRAGPREWGAGGGKLSLCSLVGPCRIEGGPVSKGWGLSLSTAAALRLTWASSQWKGMGCF